MINNNVRILKYDNAEVYAVFTCPAVEQVEVFNTTIGMPEHHGGLTQMSELLKSGFSSWQEAKDWCDINNYDVIDGFQTTEKRFEIK